MNKVPVDRELLERTANVLDAHNYGKDAEALMAALAQPAEVGGVEVVAYVGCQARMTTDGWENGEEYVVFADQASDADKRYDVPLMTVTQHLAALSAVTAERDRLQKKWARVESERDQLRAEVEALRKDAAIGQAIQRACGQLPEGFIITLRLEKDAGTLELCLPDTDAALDEFDGDTFADQINEAIDTAMERNP